MHTLKAGQVILPHFIALVLGLEPGRYCAVWWWMVSGRMLGCIEVDLAVEMKMSVQSEH